MSKNRSKGFPIINLQKSIKIVTEASKNGRNITNDELAAFGSKSTDKASAKSGAYFRRRASLKDFGLIALGKKENLYVTDLAHNIAYGETDEIKAKAKIQAFLMPELFNKIYNELQKNVELQKQNNIGNKAIASGVLPVVRDKFIMSFVESGVEAGLIKELNKDTVILYPQIKSLRDDESVPQPITTVDTPTVFDYPPADVTDITPTYQSPGSEEVAYRITIEGAGVNHDFVLKTQEDLAVLDVILVKVRNKLSGK